MKGIGIALRLRMIALAGLACLSMIFAGGGASAVGRQGCQAVGPDSASCSFFVTETSTIQVVAVAGQYWEVDVISGSFTSLCTFGRTGAAVGQCVASAGSTVSAFVREGAIVVQAIPGLPALTSIP